MSEASEVPMLDELTKEVIEALHESGWDFDKAFPHFHLPEADREDAKEYWMDLDRDKDIREGY
jgi:hypothetical protein